MDWTQHNCPPSCSKAEQWKGEQMQKELGHFLGCPSWGDQPFVVENPKMKRTIDQFDKPKMLDNGLHQRLCL